MQFLRSTHLTGCVLYGRPSVHPRELEKGTGCGCIRTQKTTAQSRALMIRRCSRRDGGSRRQTGRAERPRCRLGGSICVRPRGDAWRWGDRTMG